MSSLGRNTAETTCDALFIGDNYDLHPNNRGKIRQKVQKLGDEILKIVDFEQYLTLEVL